MDEEWVGWLGTNEDKNFFYKVNIHPRHEYPLGRIWAIAPHERAHITQFSLFREGVLGGYIDPSMGVTTFHSPENTQAEFNAQTIEQMALRALGSGDERKIRKDVAWMHRFQADYHYYSEMVWNNAHIMINSGAETEEVVRYVEERLLLDTHENITKTVPARRDNTFLRSYFGGAYWPSLAAGMEMIKPGHFENPEGEQPDARDMQPLQRAVLGLTMTRPMHLDDVKGKIAEANLKSYSVT